MDFEFDEGIIDKYDFDQIDNIDLLSENFNPELDIKLEDIIFEYDKEETIETSIIDDFDLFENNFTSMFANFISSQEIKYFKKSFIWKYFNPNLFPVDINQLLIMNSSDLWSIDCAYGLTYQAYVAQYFNKPIICTSKKRNTSKELVKYSRTKRNRLKMESGDPIYLEMIKKNVKIEVGDARRVAPKNHVLIHIFVLDLLLHPYYGFCVEWMDKAKLIFRIVDCRAIAHIWMIVKQNECSDYENFARGIRFKRTKGEMFRQMTTRQKCVYQLTNLAIKDYEQRRKQNKLSIQLLNKFKESV